jgi:aldose sugar dehydrogenase
LLDVILHPEFKKNETIYLSYSKPRTENNQLLSTTAIMKATLRDNQLYDQEVIFEALPYARTRHHYGSRMVFGKDGHLYFSVGDRGNQQGNPQNIENDLGKIHRVKADGSIPADNPFVQTKNARPSVFSYGHRNPQGLVVHPKTGEIWSHEHGPRGGDEINLVQKGKNYGWPVISYGINYNGTTFTDKTAMTGMEQPLLYWIPSIAPSGMAFINSKKYKNWNGALLTGSLRFKYLNLSTVNGHTIKDEAMLFENIGRLRDVEMGPDGYVYIAVENPGIIYRLQL